MSVFWVGPAHDRRRYRISEADAASPSIGGEGLVYRARDAHEMPVALKLLSATRVEECDRLSERLAPFALLQHPNLLRHREVFVGSGLVRRPESNDDFDVVYTAADWVEGEPLTAVRSWLHAADAIEIITQIARGVAELHRPRPPHAPQGLVHRDLKPSNVRVSPDRVARIIDFGIARPLTDDDMTVGAGTYRWRSPETLSGSGPLGPMADVWGVGAIAHWLFTGEPPSLDGAGAARERILTSDLCRMLPQPASTAKLVSQLLESSPQARPKDLDGWATALRRAQQPRPRRRPVLVAAAAGLIGLAAYVAVSGDAPQPALGTDTANSGGSTVTTATPAPSVAETLSADRPACPAQTLTAMPLSARWEADGSFRLTVQFTNSCNYSQRPTTGVFTAGYENDDGTTTVIARSDRFYFNGSFGDAVIPFVESGGRREWDLIWDADFVQPEFGDRPKLAQDRVRLLSENLLAQTQP